MHSLISASSNWLLLYHHEWLAEKIDYIILQNQLVFYQYPGEL